MIDLSQPQVVEHLLREPYFDPRVPWRGGSEELSVKGRLLGGSLMKRISAVELAGALLEGFNVLGESWSSFGGCCEIPGHEDNGYYGNRDVKALLSSREP
jgi:hypothetical protein